MSLSRFKHSVVAADLEQSVSAAARLMRDRRVGCVVVTRNGRAIGVLTDRDIALRVVAEGKDPDVTRVEEVATLDPITVREDEGIESVIARMEMHGIRRLPVVTADGQICGIVTADDLVVLLGRELGGLCKMLEDSSDASDSK